MAKMARVTTRNREKPIKRVAAYYRVSSKAQEDRGTIENQKHECRDMEGKSEWEVVAEFSDNAVTGNSPLHERPDGRKLVEGINSGVFDGVWAVHVDRLTRSESMAERGEIYDLLSENGLALITPSDGEMRFDGFTGEAMYSLKSLMAAEERRRIQERAKQGIWRAGREGRRACGMNNYGMDWVPSRDNPKLKEWRVNDRELATLKEAARLIKAGVGREEIVRMFNADPEKYPTKYAKRWSAENLTAKFYQDFLYTGERTFKVGPDQYENIKIVGEPFFTKEEVMEIRHLLRQKRRGHGRLGPDAKRGRFLLHHLAECACGAEKIGVQDFTPQGKPYKYYRCRECGLRLDAEKTDRSAWEIYTEVLTNPKALKAAVLEEDFIVNKNTQQLKQLRDASAKRLEELEGCFERLNRTYARGHMKDEQYEELEKEFATEQIKCERDLRQAVNTLNRPKERDRAIERAAVRFIKFRELIGKLEEGRDLLKRQIAVNANSIEELLRDLDLIEVGVADSLKLIDELSAEQEPEGYDDVVFKIKKKLFDELILTGGRIILSAERIEIHGRVRTEDPEVFNEEILGTGRFG